MGTAKVAASCGDRGSEVGRVTNGLDGDGTIRNRRAVRTAREIRRAMVEGFILKLPSRYRLLSDSGLAKYLRGRGAIDKPR